MVNASVNCQAHTDRESIIMIQKQLLMVSIVWTVSVKCHATSILNGRRVYSASAIVTGSKILTSEASSTNFNHHMPTMMISKVSTTSGYILPSTFNIEPSYGTAIKSLDSPLHSFDNEEAVRFTAAESTLSNIAIATPSIAFVTTEAQQQPMNLLSSILATPLSINPTVNFHINPVQSTAINVTKISPSVISPEFIQYPSNALETIDFEKPTLMNDPYSSNTLPINCKQTADKQAPNHQQKLNNSGIIDKIIYWSSKQEVLPNFWTKLFPSIKNGY